MVFISNGKLHVSKHVVFPLLMNTII